MHLHPVSVGCWLRRLTCVAVVASQSGPAAAAPQSTFVERERPVPATPATAPRQISAYVREVFEDRQGRRWFGTNDEGLALYDGGSLRFLDVRHGLGGNAVRGIAERSDGELWFATDGGVSRYRDGRFRTFTVADGLSDNSVWSLLIDRAGTVWVGTHEGVCRLEGERFVPFPLPRVAVETPESRFTPKVVFAICEDRAGHLWFGTDGEGVHRYDGRSFTSYTTKEGLGGMMVRAIHEDRKGHLWFGSDGGGVSRFDGASFRTFTSRDGLGNNRIFEIHEDREGVLWCSTLGEGLSRFDGERFQPVGRALSFDGIPCACGSGKPTAECHGSGGIHVQDIFEDRSGVLWLGCSGGLFRREGARFVNVTREGPWPASSIAEEALAPFARMIGGEWRVRFASGTTQFDRWSWGPGRRSIVSHTYGTDAQGGPWRVLTVYYWHPGERRIRMVSMHPDVPTIGRGVGEGRTIWSGDRMTTSITLRQSERPDAPRAIEARWEFRGPDAYRSSLAEDAGRGFEELVAWEYTRSRELSELPPIPADVAAPSDAFAALRPFLLQAEGAAETADDGRSGTTITSVEWIPLAEALRIRIEALPEAAGLGRSVELVVIRPSDPGPLRLLVLSESGRVFEGSVVQPDDGSIWCTLRDAAVERGPGRPVSMTREAGGIRVRVWVGLDAPKSTLADVLLQQPPTRERHPSAASGESPARGN